MAGNSLTENQLIILQALVRGFLVRQKIKEVRNEFEEIVAGLEEQKFVHWKKNALGYPFIKSEGQFFNSANKGNKTGVSGNALDHAEDIAAVIGMNRCDSQENLVLNNSGLCDTCLDDQIPSDANFPICEDENNVQELFITEACTDNRGENQNNEMLAGGKTADHPQHKEVTPIEIPDFPVVLSLSSTPRCSNGENEDIQSYRLCNGRSDSTDKSPLHVPDQSKPFLRGNQILSESWMTEKSFDPVISEESKRLPSDPVQLQELRDHITMELLWTEQAIQSRKKYLSLKKEMLQSDVEEDSSVG